ATARWGVRRGSNSPCWSHNPAPSPDGHAHHDRRPGETRTPNAPLIRQPLFLELRVRFVGLGGVEPLVSRLSTKGSTVELQSRVGRERQNRTDRERFVGPPSPPGELFPVSRRCRAVGSHPRCPS